MNIQVDGGPTGSSSSSLAFICSEYILCFSSVGGWVCV